MFAFSRDYYIQSNFKLVPLYRYIFRKHDIANRPKYIYIGYISKKKKKKTLPRWKPTIYFIHYIHSSDFVLCMGAVGHRE